MGKAKVGHINFINCLPLTYSFEKGGFAKGLEIVSAVPTVLNNDIVNDRLDVSPVSSIVYARNSEKFLIMPNVAISADGNVQSIILVSKKPIDELTNDKIILTAKSATSHCLLKIVLNKAYGAKPNYYIRIIDMKHIIPEDATATLLIGDDALYANHNHQDGFDPLWRALHVRNRRFHGQALPPRGRDYAHQAGSLLPRVLRLHNCWRFNRQPKQLCTRPHHQVLNLVEEKALSSSTTGGFSFY